MACDWKEEQARDDTLVKLLQLISGGKENIQPVEPALKVWEQEREILHILDGILTRRKHNNDGSVVNQIGQ